MNNIFKAPSLLWALSTGKSDETLRPAVTGSIRRDARAQAEKLRETLSAAKDAIGQLNDYLARAEPEPVLKSRFCVALLLVLPLALLIWASLLLAQFGLEMIPDGRVRDASALALVAGTLLAIHTFLLFATRRGWLIFVLSGVATIALAQAQFLVAKSRAAVIAEWVVSSGTSVVETDQGIGTSAGLSTLTTTLLPLLTSLLPLMAVGIELMAGIALHCILAAVFDPEFLAYRRRARLQRRVAALSAAHVRASDLAENSDGDADLSKAIAHRVGGMLSKDTAIAMLVALGLILFLASQLSAAPLDAKNGCVADGARVGIAVDLSKSRDEAELKADIAIVTRALSVAPPCSHLVIVGIGEDGWGAPIVLLDARIKTTGGWMQQDLKSARQRLVAAWAEISQTLTPGRPGSDVIGALLYTAELLELGPGHAGTLICLSDGRQTRGINLETGGVAPSDSTVQHAKRLGLVANLPGSTIGFFGVSTTGRTREYWGGLKSFWTGWTALTGARLVDFSIGRNVCLPGADCGRGANVPVALPIQQNMKRAPVPESTTVEGHAGFSDQWSSAWLDLHALADFHTGDTLRLSLGGPARKVIVRILGRHDEPNSPGGVDGGVQLVPQDGIVHVTLTRDHKTARQISVHAGMNPFGLYWLGGDNKTVRLLNVQRICKH